MSPLTLLGLLTLAAVWSIIAVTVYRMWKQRRRRSRR